MVSLKNKLAKKQGKFHPYKCDISVESDILNAFDNIKKNIGPISILVNNAGIVSNSTLVEGKTEVWRKTLEVNVLGK